MKEISSFDFLVKPTVNPDLSDYIQNLTGISQTQIDVDAIDFPLALQRFFTFCEGTSYVCSNGDDDRVIIENCDLHKIDCPDTFKNAINLRSLFSKALGMNDSDIHSCNLTAHFGLPSVGKHHDAVEDARGVAAALSHLTTSFQYSQY
jgi:inhibitor of KinA sporulation pathway (predicted exonuclease)